MITVEKVKKEKAKEIQKAVNPQPKEANAKPQKAEKSFFQKYKWPILGVVVIGGGLAAWKLLGKKKGVDDFSNFN